MSYLSELKNFIGYCNDFYNKQYGIYPIATSEVIAGAITKYINTSYILGIDVQFDSIDRERVRAIIEGFEPNTIPSFATPELIDMCSPNPKN
jgi:hypothetical protein|tara:strand:- start:700 stop:975 length:276 start_codon:yes stop_codon:yes gene_type:complete